VETGGCPHTAIREDASMNLEAVEELVQRFPDIQIVFIESGETIFPQLSVRNWPMPPYMSSMWPKVTKFPEKAARE